MSEQSPHDAYYTNLNDETVYDIPPEPPQPPQPDTAEHWNNTTEDQVIRDSYLAANGFEHSVDNAVDTMRDKSIKDKGYYEAVSSFAAEHVRDQVGAVMPNGAPKPSIEANPVLKEVLSPIVSTAESSATIDPDNAEKIRKFTESISDNPRYREFFQVLSMVSLAGETQHRTDWAERKASLAGKLNELIEQDPRLIVAVNAKLEATQERAHGPIPLTKDETDAIDRLHASGRSQAARTTDARERLARHKANGRSDKESADLADDYLARFDPATGKMRDDYKPKNLRDRLRYHMQKNYYAAAPQAPRIPKDKQTGKYPEPDGRPLPPRSPNNYLKLNRAEARRQQYADESKDFFEAKAFMKRVDAHTPIEDRIAAFTAEDRSENGDPYERRATGMKEILGEVQWLRENQPPDMLSESYNMMQTYDALNDGLAEWREADGFDSIDAEHTIFTENAKLSAQIEDIDRRINALPKNHFWRSDYAETRAYLVGMHYGSLYKQGILLSEKAAVHGEGPEEAAYAGKGAVKMTAEKGVRIAPNLVLYGDSYAHEKPGAVVEDRRNYDGTPWTPDAAASRDFTPKMTQAEVDAMSDEELEDNYFDVADEWFMDQSPTAQQNAQLLAINNKRRAEARLVAEPDNEDAKYDVNYYTYWDKYHSILPGKDSHKPGMPRLNGNGTINMNGELNGITGKWTIEPNGSATLYEKRGSGRWAVRKFDANGHEL